MPYTCAIDFGTDNFAAIVCDDGSSVIYKGGAVLSDTQWFHKQKAKYVSILTKGYKNQYAASKRSSDLSYHHANFVKDQCHKISRSIIDFCVDHQAGTLIFGVNPLWKQNSRIGKINNQKFVSMPIAFLRAMITYKALNAGIKIIEQEESYTSKADIATKDYIPTYGVDDKDAQFSGLRIKRGLYRCADGTILNADCHAAANIMRKAVPDIWDRTTDFSFLASPKVYGFHELNPKSIPVKGCDLGFDPVLGDLVEIFEDEDQIIVTKAKKEPENHNDAGININMTNSINNASDVAAGNGKKVVNKVAYCLLALFLGGFGVHKFYKLV